MYVCVCQYLSLARYETTIARRDVQTCYGQCTTSHAMHNRDGVEVRGKVKGWAPTSHSKNNHRSQSQSQDEDEDESKDYRLGHHAMHACRTCHDACRGQHGKRQSSEGWARRKGDAASTLLPTNTHQRKKRNINVLGTDNGKITQYRRIKPFKVFNDKHNVWGGSHFTIVPACMFACVHDTRVQVSDVEETSASE